MPRTRWSPLLAVFCALCVSANQYYEELVKEARANNGLLKLDSASFEKLTAPDRDWSATVQLTALGSSFKCAPCKSFEPSFVAIAQAWTRAPESERNQHFFATLDFENGSDIFKKLGLNAAPIVYTYPAAKGPRRPSSGKVDPILYDFTNGGFEAAALAEGLNRHMPSQIPYRPPMDWTPVITLLVLALGLLIGAPFIMPLLLNKWIWAALSIGISLTMISGFMFVRIRGNPYVAAGPGGQAQWIAQGTQNQYGMETQVVAFIYGLLSFSCLSLILFIPRIPGRTKQSLAIYIWSSVASVVFAVLLSYFRIKFPGYPFRLFL